MCFCARVSCCMVLACWPADERPALCSRPLLTITLTSLARTCTLLHILLLYCCIGPRLTSPPPHSHVLCTKQPDCIKWLDSYVKEEPLDGGAAIRANASKSKQVTLGGFLGSRPEVSSCPRSDSGFSPQRTFNPPSPSQSIIMNHVAEDEEDESSEEDK